MPRICTRVSDGKLIEAQSNATAGTLLKNALAAGYAAGEVEEREVSHDEMAAAIDAQQARDEPAAMPKGTLEEKIAAIKNLDDVKAILKDHLK